MKKFSTYNGLFTGCPSIITQPSYSETRNSTEDTNTFPTSQNDELTSNNFDYAEQKNRSYTSNFPQSETEQEKQTEIFHYPQSEGDYDIFNQSSTEKAQTAQHNNKNFNQNNDKVNYFMQNNNSAQSNSQSASDKQTTSNQNAKEKANTNSFQEKKAENILSQKAKVILECMKMHDRIIQNYNDKN